MPIASFTFGCPEPELVARLHEREVSVWVTVTEVAEAGQAVASGADALVVQGVEAGGHRGSFADVDGRGELSVLSLLRLVARACERPLVASGGIADGAGVAATLVAGACAAQIGTGFMRAHDLGAPSAYPQVHHLTAPLRAAARAAGDPDDINLWAGEAYELARALPAADLVAHLSEEAHLALGRALHRLDGGPGM